MEEIILRLPPRTARRLVEEARRAGQTLEEYVMELLARDLDPPRRAEEYAHAARALLEQAREELAGGDHRQAAEKVWSAAALAVKAYAAWRDGVVPESHGELWRYKRVLAADLGEWVDDAWFAAQSMHVCLVKGWCLGEDVGAALGRVARLVEEVARRVVGGETGG